MTRTWIEKKQRLTWTGAAVVVVTGVMASTAWGEGSELPDPGPGMWQIKALPFMDTGDTSDNDDNLDIVFGDCTYTGSTAPEVFYSIVPLTDISIDITLCDSSYDTRLYVLDEGQQPIACNEDRCRDGQGDPTLRSELECVALLAGQQYYIGVDGFGNESGPYTIEVTVCIPPPPYMCPEGADEEGELCVEGMPDNFNGGCNFDPQVFSPIACDQTICGTTWGFGGGALRDTDWYQIVTTAEQTFTLEGSFSFANGIMGFITMDFGFEGSGDCDKALGITPSVVGGPGEIVSITTTTLPPGTHWFFVAPDLPDAVACAEESDYWIRLTCRNPIACPQCIGDSNGDGVLDFADILPILADWGPCP